MGLVVFTINIVYAGLFTVVRTQIKLNLKKKLFARLEKALEEILLSHCELDKILIMLCVRSHTAQSCHPAVLNMLTLPLLFKVFHCNRLTQCHCSACFYFIYLFLWKSK